MAVQCPQKELKPCRLEVGVERSYRGHAIKLCCADCWSAVIVNQENGVVLPTKATATQHEGRNVALERAIRLIDLYAEAMGAGPLVQKT